MSKQSFLKGALVLIVASLITRFLGVIMQVYTSRLMQAEGVGLFRLVWPILSLLITLSSVGFPIAISKVVAEALAVHDQRRVKRIMKFSFITVTLLSCMITAIFIYMAPWLSAHENNDPRTYYPMIAMAPAIPIITIAWVIHGYFQGIQNQTPRAVSSILETIARVAVGIPMIYILLPYGLGYAAAGSMIGVVAGELVGFLYLGYLYLNKYRITKITQVPLKTERFVRTLYSLGEIALPITFQRILSSIAFALEPMIVMNALQAAGILKQTATAQYGALGMAITLFVWPTVITWSLETTIIPAVSEAIAVKAYHLVQRRLYQAIRVTILIGLPASVIFSLLAKDLAITIYNEPMAGPLLAILAPFGIFLYLHGPLSGVLKGLNRAGLQTTISLIGSAIKLTLIYFLASRPDLGIRGVAISLCLTYMVITFFYGATVAKYVGITIHLHDTLKIAFSASIMALIVIQTKMALTHWSQPAMISIAILLSSSVYCILLLLFRIVSLRSIERIPKIGPVLSLCLRWIPFIRY
ncbi:stage V sporulation protein B [Collibacillus ludicampi]|uniref:Stage V sporulation protein B n=1 Tax=Collibacillus ludicampi TaxID=2771369 RepID=A0AAV4LHG2_9BACL|nr:stage V sporulation protein B [Collibacillus ludicampi]GIM47220.1 stage V sporulation protein B [Collibacillus ludicampi]